MSDKAHDSLKDTLKFLNEYTAGEPDNFYMTLDINGKYASIEGTKASLVDLAENILNVAQGDFDGCHQDMDFPAFTHSNGTLTVSLVKENESHLKRSSPASLGIKPSAILSMIEQWERLGGMNSFILLRHGQVAAEGWWKPYTPDKRHMLFSLSKSFTSIASAFAVAEGKLDYEDTVVSFFPEYMAKIVQPDEKLLTMKVKHLLSMTTGHEPNADFIFDSEDCVEAFLTSKPGHEPGNGFAYNTGATYMVSAIVQKVTGEKVIDYLKPRLFDPLCICGISWDECAHGIDYGGFGLNVKTEDIAKFGQFLLQRGMWKGKQLLPAALVDAATSKHINNWGGSAYQLLDDFQPEILPDDAKQNDWAQGYGRQFWRCIPDGVYRGDGAFGQLCVVMPKYDVVVACTAGLGDMQGELRAIWDNINDDAFCDTDCFDGQAQIKLDMKLASLSLNCSGAGDNKGLRQYNNIVYKMDNGNDFDRISFEFGEVTDRIKLWYGESIVNTIIAGHGRWEDNEHSARLNKNKAVNIGGALSSETPESDDKYASYSAAALAEDNVYTITAVQNLTPFIQTYTFTFNGGELSVKAHFNVGGGDSEFKGKAAE